MSKKAADGFSAAVIVVAVLVVGVLVAGGWYVWQANNKPQPVATQQTVTKFKKFTDASGLFSFEYKDNWQITSSGQNQINATSPDVAYEDMPIGGQKVAQGAKVQITLSDTTMHDTSEIFTGIRANVANKKSVTVSGVSAVQYEFSYESQRILYTEGIKNGKLFSISYASKDDERSGDNFDNYQHILTSFTFLK